MPIKQLILTIFLIFLSYPAIPAESEYFHLELSKDTALANALYRTAQKMQDRAIYDSAIFYYELAAKSYGRKKYLKNYFECRNNIISVKRRTGQTEGIIEEAFANLGNCLKKYGENNMVSADCYSILGNLYSDNGIQDSSLFFFRKSMSIMTALPERDNEKIAGVFRNIGVVFNEKGLFDSVSCYIRKSTELLKNLFGPDHPEMAGNYNLLGTIAYHLGRFEECKDYFTKIVKIREAHSGISHPLTAEAYNNLAVLYMAMGNYDTALTLNQRALRIRVSALPENHTNIALSYNNIGNSFMAKGNYDQALVYHEKALDIRQKIFKEDNPNMAMSYANLGSLFHETGRFNEALKYFLNALHITEKVFGPDNPHTAEAYNNVGAAFSDLGDYDRSLEYFKTSLMLRRKRGEFSPGISTSYNNIGSIYKYRGDYDLALAYYRRSIEVIKRLYGDNHPDLVLRYKNMGEVYETEGMVDTALYYYNKALELDLAGNREENAGQASIYLNRGIAFEKLNELKKAKNDFSEGSRITKQLLGDDNLSTANFYSALSSVLLTEHKKDSALLLQRKSVRIKEKYYPEKHPVLASIYRETGELYEKLGLSDSARYSYLRSLSSNYPESSLHEQLNTSVILDENEFALTIIDICRLNFEDYEKTGDKNLLVEITKHYENLKKIVNISISDYALEETKINLLNKLAEHTAIAVEAATILFKSTGDPVYYYKALEFSELNKSSILQNLIYRYRTAGESGVTERLLRKKKDLHGHIGYLQLKLQKPGADTVYTPVKKIRNTIDSLMLVLREVNDTINISAVQSSASYMMSGRELFDEIRSRLTDNDALISYYLTDSSLYKFVITRDTSVILKNAFSEKNYLYALTDKYLSSLRKYEREKLPALNSELYEILFGDLEILIKSKEKLVIVPDKYLFSLPLETLCSTMATTSEFTDFSKFDYLIKNHEFVYHYSIGLWCTDSSGAGKTDDGFIAFAPVFSGQVNSDRVKTSSPFRKSFSELPYSLTEADSLRNMFESRGFNTRVFTFSDATEENLKNSIGRFSYIHIATHSIVDKRNPEHSGLVLLPDNSVSVDTLSESGNDGILYARDLYPLDINADLVVLSGCETGTGKLEEGEGIIGLIRGFLLAGARNVIFSFWKVGDKNTLLFMNDFYKYFLNGISYSQAVKNAKTELINNDETSYPLFWGGFGLIGH